ncbi:PIN domain-containing protein [Embleya sp. NBC_00896]|uniref:PIN domain-containing protein n=1 Tax=Embleya sp. NBC_00896 TaxID=2975961 RepID=UPI00386C5357|nr:hypothetical protein OG928_32550 [Embleya sp. NBC_00896]
MWLRLKAETGWDTTAAEQGLDLADRFRTDTRLSEEIAGALLGATAGPADPNSSDRPERWDPTEDQVARFRALVDRASPHNPVFRRIPATSNELVNLVRTTLGPRQGTIAAAEDGVRIGAIPIAVLAERAERPVGLAYALRAGGLIPAATHEPQLLASEFTAARTALDGTVILDTGTAVVANLIPERFDQLRAQFADVLIATPCHDDLVKTRVGLDEILRTSGQLGFHDGHVIMTHVRDEDKRALRERRADLINAIPTLNPHDIRDDHTLLARLNEHGYTTLDNPPWLAGAQLALDKTAPLWCDDAAMRRLLHEIDIPTFGTMALLHVLTHDEQRNDFTLERARQDIRVLLREHVVDLPLSTDDILWAAENDQWKPGGATTAVFATPSRWGHDGEDLWLAFVEHAWAKAPHTLGDWYRTAAHGYTALARPDRLTDALARLAALTILAAGVGPEPVHALDTVAQATLTACAEALEARLAGLEEAVEPRSTADPGDWRRTTKATLVSLLVDHRGLAPATANAIAAQAFEG